MEITQIRQEIIKKLQFVWLFLSNARAWKFFFSTSHLIVMLLTPRKKSCYGISPWEITRYLVTDKWGAAIYLVSIQILRNGLSVGTSVFCAIVMYLLFGANIFCLKFYRTSFFFWTIASEEFISSHWWTFPHCSTFPK